MKTLPRRPTTTTRIPTGLPNATTRLPNATWWVFFRYAGGNGRVTVTARAEDDATAEGMLRAKHGQAGGKRVYHQATFRVLRFDELENYNNRGITAAYDLTWDRRDHGEPYLIVERGSAKDDDGFDVWLPLGRLANSVKTVAAGKRLISLMHERHASATLLYDIVHRDTVQICESDANYGPEVVDGPTMPAKRHRNAKRTAKQPAAKQPAAKQPPTPTRH